jgi:hypothetical protein
VGGLDPSSSAIKRPELNAHSSGSSPKKEAAAGSTATVLSSARH